MDEERPQGQPTDAPASGGDAPPDAAAAAMASQAAGVPPAGGFEAPPAVPPGSFEESAGAGPSTAEASGGTPRGESPLEAGLGGGGVASEHPELLVGAAFAGGFAIAQILKRLGP